MGAVLAFVKREPVFCAAAVAAALSVCAVPPNAGYADYFNWNLMACLLCFMLCVAGLTAAGVFDALARASLRGERSVGFVAGVLVALPFFVSMFVTNDVALIAFVPFALLVLGRAGRPDLAALVVVLQSVAANMGSMLTPFGNPQNLYIYEEYATSIGDFLAVSWPVTALNGLLLAGCVAAMAIRGTGRRLKLPACDRGAEFRGTDALLFGGAFAVCVLYVLQVVPVLVMLGVCLLVAAVRNVRLLAKVDWFLLGTFLCFFVFSGNLAAIPAVHGALTGAMATHPFLIPLAASQIISNVPAAVLLEPFTANWQALLLAVDIGGLGTPVASLASLISLGFYRTMRPEGAASLGRYMVLFLVLNFAFMGLNCVLKVLLFG